MKRPTPPAPVQRGSLLVTVLALALSAPAQSPKPTLAFPGAEGAGALTPGGRGGRVIEVTTLADSGPGSLREALAASGRRIVVFRVGGIIELKSRLQINEPYVTVAGQSAPGDGICIKGETTELNTHDVILRYVRFRRGELKRRDDALGGYPQGNIILDHLSTSWGLDENISLYRWIEKGPDGKDIKRPTTNTTIQWCISSEALDLNNHAFGGTQGGKNVSIHHNLFASNTGRNPSIGYGDHVDFRNNVLFNWQHRTIDGGDATSHLNIVNNYFKPGPACGEGDIKFRICRPQHLNMFAEGTTLGKWFVSGNVMEGNQKVTKNNWDGGVQFDEPDIKRLGSMEKVIEQVRGSAAWDAPKLTEQSAEEAYKLVLEGVGATLPKRDAVDKRIIESVKSGKPTVGKNGILVTPADAGGWPSYKGGSAPKDSDHNGLPDAWEKRHKLSDPSGDPDGDGYTNVEEYLNGTNPHQTTP
jgi:pectate lyase